MKPEYPNIPKCHIQSPDREARNIVRYWGFFSKHDLLVNPSALLMLDVDFGRDCSLRCPSCFRRQNNVDDSVHPDLSYSEGRWGCVK